VESPNDGRRLDWGVLTVVFLALLRSVHIALVADSRVASFQSLWPLDLANINQVIWNTVHGSPFSSTIVGDSLRAHFDPLLMLLSLPYLFSDNLFWVFLLYSLLISAGAVAVYLLARRSVDGRLIPVLLAVYYLTYAPLLELNVLQIRGDVLAVPLLVFAFLLYSRRRFAAFVLFGCLALMCKETVAVVMLLWGGYAVVGRRGLKWALAPALTGAAVLVFTLFIYHPYIQGSPYHHSGLVTGSLELAPGVLGHLPSWWFLLTRYFLYYGLVGVLYPAPLVLGSPFLMGSFVWRSVLLEDMWFHLFAPALPFLFAAVVGATGKLLARFQRARALPIVLAAALVLSSALMVFQSRATLSFPEQSDEDRAVWALIGQIPPDAAVAAPPLVLVPLSTRHTLRCLALHQYKGTRMDVLDVDYVLLEIGPAPWSRLITMDKKGSFEADYQEAVEEVRSGREFELVDRRMGWELHRRAGSETAVW
jgi:uncharacterized membrane protein